MQRRELRGVICEALSQLGATNAGIVKVGQWLPASCGHEFADLYKVASRARSSRHRKHPFDFGTSHDELIELNLWFMDTLTAGGTAAQVLHPPGSAAPPQPPAKANIRMHPIWPGADIQCVAIVMY
jgi:hypothetical protein